MITLNWKKIIGAGLFVGLLVGCERSSQVSHPLARYVKAMHTYPVTFDPSQMNDLYSITVGNLIYAGLLEFNEDLEITGDLAESYQTSRDGKTLSFTLRDGAKFHDGTPVRSDHVVASLKRLIAPESLVYSYYECIEGAADYHSGRSQNISGLVAASPRQVAIKLNAPFPPFLSVLAGGTAKVLPVGMAFDRKSFFKHPIGSGPFEITEIGPGVLELKRFNRYHGPPARMERLGFAFIPLEEATRRAKLGQVHDMVSYPTVGTEEVFSKVSGGASVDAPLAETWIIGLNTRMPPFNSLETRLAFRKSVPAAEFRKNLHPLSLKANGYVPPGLPGHLKESDEPRLRKIRQVDGHGSISKTPITVAFPTGMYRGAEMKSFIQNTLRARGWNITLKEMAWSELMEGYTHKTWQAFLVTMNMDYPDPEFLFRNFESGNQDNFSGISDKTVDRLIRETRQKTDRLERGRLYRDLSFRIAELVPFVEILHPRGYYWLNTCVRGFKANPLSHAYTDYRSIFLDSECAANSKGGPRV